MRDEGDVIAQIEASGHSVFAPSAAHRWMTCPASLRACLDAKAAAVEDDEASSTSTGSNFFTVEGTAAHHLAEVWLTTGKAPEHLRGTPFARDGIEVVFDDEMFVEVERYVNWCKELGGGLELVETKVFFGDLFPIPGQGGTCDHLHWSNKRGVLTITDLKYGKGVRVFAEKNPQGALYAVGALRHLRSRYGDAHMSKRLERIVIRIAQPRLDHFDVWEVTPGDLALFENEVRRAAALAWAPNAPFRPEPKACRFCPIKIGCSALADHIQGEMDSVFEPCGDAPERAAERISTERMAELLRWRPTVDSLFAAIEAELLRRAEAGEAVPHYKIVEGRHRREWRDAAAAAEWLAFVGLAEDEIWTRRLISPHQAELALRAKRVPKRVIAAEVTSVAGPRTLAPTLDPRTALVGNADVFEPVAEDDDDLS